MKKLKITLLVFYVLMIIILIYESAIPKSLSSKEQEFFKKIVNNISRLFVKTKYVDAEEIVINSNLNEYYYINDTLTLDISVKPDNSSYKELNFTSTNTDILTIDNTGYIEFLSEGNASVIIKQNDCNLEKQIDFKVIKKEEPVIEVIEPVSMTVSIEKTTLNMGELAKIKVDLHASDSSKKVNDTTLIVTSSDKHISAVYDGYLYALNEGAATITITHKNTGLEEKIDVEILEHELIPPDKETFKIKGNKVIYMNDTTTHTYTVDIDPNVSDIYKKVYYRTYYYDKNASTSIKEKIPGLSINWREGKAKPVEAGYVSVFAYIYDVENSKWSEYCDGMVVEVKNVLPNFNLNDRRIVLGNPYKLTITPTNKSNVTYNRYEYFSSDESIASIDNLGNITPHKKGKTTITVRVDDEYHNVEKSFELTVDSKVMEDDMGNRSFFLFVRKGLSHFMGFVVFGIISSFMFLMFINANYDGNKKLNIVVTIINGLVFSSLTEFIQLFAIDRGANINDIGIDYLGYMLAVTLSFVIITIIYLVKKKKRKSNENKDITNEE